DVSEESARHQSALASAALARLALERQQALVKRGSASQAQLDQARAERDIAEANARQLAALIAKKTLTAPFDGIAGLHDLEAGDYLEANTPLVLLQGLSDSLWVDFSLSPAQGRLDIGDAVRVVAPDAGGEQLAGTVIARDPALSDQSRNLRYRAQLAATPLLPVRAVVTVRVPVAAEARIQVPAQAVLRDEIGSYVYLLDPDGDAYRARRRGVELGGSTATPSPWRRALPRGSASPPTAPSSWARACAPWSAIGPLSTMPTPMPRRAESWRAARQHPMRWMWSSPARWWPSPCHWCWCWRA